MDSALDLTTETPPVDPAQLLLMISGLTTRAMAEERRMDELQKLVREKDEKINLAEEQRLADKDEMEALKVTVDELSKQGNGTVERQLSEVRIEKTFGDDTSPRALNTFLSHYNLVKEQNSKRKVRLWDDADYRAGALRMALTNEVSEYVDEEDSMGSMWVKTDDEIIGKLKERYLKAECIEMNILKFEEARQLDGEDLATFLTRLQRLARNAFPKNPEGIIRQRVIWRFLSGVTDTEIRRELISTKWMVDESEPKSYEEILKIAESTQMTRVASQTMSSINKQRKAGTSGGNVGAVSKTGNDKRVSWGGVTSQERGSRSNRGTRTSGGMGTRSTSYESSPPGMECWYCSEVHAGGWRQCAKMLREDPGWKPPRHNTTKRKDFR